MGVQAKWRLWQLIETNGLEVWQLSWEGEGAKDGHTLCNDIKLDKCRIRAFAAFKKKAKLNLNGFCVITENKGFELIKKLKD